MTVFNILLNGIHHINLVKIEDINFFFRLRRKCKKNHGKDGVCKMKTKTYFSKAHSILELMLCNWNLTKLVYETLVSSDCRAWALKLSEHLKKWQKMFLPSFCQFPL